MDRFSQWLLDCCVPLLIVYCVCFVICPSGLGDGQTYSPALLALDSVLSAGWPAVMVHSSKLRIQEEPEYEARLVFGVRPCLKKENLLVGF